MSDHLNDEAVEALLSGHERDRPLGALFASIADHYGVIRPTDPGPELATFISTGGADAAAMVDLIGARRRRKRAVIAALTGTVVGKVMIGVSVAAASVAGMQASGMVDVPMLPDAHHRTVVQYPEPAETTPPTTSLSTPVVTTLAGVPSDDASDESGAATDPITANSPRPQPLDAVEQHDLRYHPEALVDSSDGGHRGGHASDESSDDDHDGDHDDDHDDDQDDDHDDDHDDDQDEHLFEDHESSGKRTTDSDTADHRSDHDDTDAGRDERDD